MSENKANDEQEIISQEALDAYIPEGSKDEN